MVGNAACQRQNRTQPPAVPDIGLPLVAPQVGPVRSHRPRGHTGQTQNEIRKPVTGVEPAEFEFAAAAAFDVRVVDLALGQARSHGQGVIPQRRGGGERTGVPVAEPLVRR